MGNWCSQAEEPQPLYHVSHHVLPSPLAVYVLDTGIRSTHYAFSGRVGAGTSMLGSSWEDDHGHGTHVSGGATCENSYAVLSGFLAISAVGPRVSLARISSGS